jgi:hypothetical protein
MSRVNSSVALSRSKLKGEGGNIRKKGEKEKKGEGGRRKKIKGGGGGGRKRKKKGGGWVKTYLFPECGCAWDEWGRFDGG